MVAPDPGFWGGWAVRGEHGKRLGDGWCRGSVAMSLQSKEDSLDAALLRVVIYRAFLLVNKMFASKNKNALSSMSIPAVAR